jgi:hypothetical protein
MAAIASPTWAEVQTFDPRVINAMNIIKGEQNGGTYLWDHETVIEQDGQEIILLGAWKHELEKSAEDPRGGDPDRFTNL